MCVCVCVCVCVCARVKQQRERVILRTRRALDEEEEPLLVPHAEVCVGVGEREIEENTSCV